MDDFDNLENEVKDEEKKKGKAKHKVSGRSVFDLKKIIENKTQTDNIAKDDDDRSIQSSN